MGAAKIIIYITLLVIHRSESQPPQNPHFRSIDFSEMDDSNLFNPETESSPATTYEVLQPSQGNEKKTSIHNNLPCNPSGKEYQETGNWPLNQLIKLHEVYQEVFILSGHINFPNVDRAFDQISQKLKENQIDKSRIECLKAYSHSLTIMKYDSASRSPEDASKIQRMREIYRNTQRIRKERQNEKKRSSLKRKNTNNTPVTNRSAKEMNNDENWTLNEILALHTVYQEVFISHTGIIKFSNQEEAFQEISSRLENEYNIKKDHKECLRVHVLQLRISKIYYSGNREVDEEIMKKIRAVIRRTGEIRDRRQQQLNEWKLPIN